jgi:hypothetical protein
MSKVEARKLWIRRAARCIASLAVAMQSMLMLRTAEPLRAQQAAPQAPTNVNWTQAAPTQSMTAQAGSAPSAAELESWRQTMLHTKRPKKACYVATYPDPAWTEVTCTEPPAVPQSPAGGQEGNQVGNGVNFSAQPAYGSIQEAEGSFDSAVRVTGESDSGVANAFSLQMNTQPMPQTTACEGVPTCKGGEQFIFSNSKCKTLYANVDSKACVYIQYWLLGFGNSCPTRWKSQASLGTDNCMANSSTAMAVPQQTVSDSELETLKLMGQSPNTATGAGDWVTLTIGTTLYSAPGDDLIPDLNNYWFNAGFNLFGDCCESEAVFNAGATLKVRTVVNNGSGVVSTPTCGPIEGWGETSNLTLVGSCSAINGAVPAIVFTETQLGKPAGTTALVYDRGAGEADVVGFNSSGVEDLDFSNNGFRATWDQIVPGDFLGNGRDEALLYDQGAGEADVVAFASNGKATLDGQNPHFRTTWNIIVPVDYLGDGQDRALFYDHNAGDADVLTFNKQGKESNDAENPTFGKSFDLIVAGNFLEKGQQQQVLAYDRNAGEGDVYTIDSGGKLTRKATNSGWRKTWDTIVVGDFLGNGKDQVMLYDSAGGEADLVAFDSIGNESLDGQNPGFGNAWNLIVAGAFLGNGRDQAVVYDQKAGEGDLIAFNNHGIVSLKVADPHWRTSWIAMNAGDFIGDGRDQVLLYDFNAGDADVVAFDSHGGVSLDAGNPSFGTPWNILVSGNFVGN